MFTFLNYSSFYGDGKAKSRPPPSHPFDWLPGSSPAVAKDLPPDATDIQIRHPDLPDASEKKLGEDKRTGYSEIYPKPPISMEVDNGPH